MFFMNILINWAIYTGNKFFLHKWGTKPRVERFNLGNKAGNVSSWMRQSILGLCFIAIALSIIARLDQQLCHEWLPKKIMFQRLIYKKLIPECSDQNKSQTIGLPKSKFSRSNDNSEFFKLKRTLTETELRKKNYAKFSNRNWMELLTRL